MIVGIPKEIAPGERRVALVPSVIGQLLERGIEVHVEAGAGAAASFANAAYEEAGAKVQPDAPALYGAAELVAKVRPPSLEECQALDEEASLVCLLQPFAHLEVVRELARRGVTCFALDLMPRITRAQSMDVLSAMSTIAGYEAVLIAAHALPKLMPLLMTAAGTVKPARVLVLGAGVAGLQAIATARRLGAVVEAFDIRAAAKEQVESLGARFVRPPAEEDAETEGGYAKEQTQAQLAAEREVLASHLASADVVICTALVPGKRAPILIREEQVRGMRPGSVIVDLAAEQGGNCELTRPGERIELEGVQVCGPLNVVSEKPKDASQMFARTLANYLSYLIEDGKLGIDFGDELVSEVVVTHRGEIRDAALRAATEP